MPFLPRTKKFKSPLDVLTNDKALEDGDNNTVSLAKSLTKREVFEISDDELISNNLKNNDKTDLSTRMNEPAIKEAYKQFLNDLSQSSGSKSSQICPTPLDEILSWSSSIPEKKKKIKNGELQPVRSTDTKTLDLGNLKSTKKRSKKNVNKSLDFQKDNEGKTKMKKARKLPKEVTSIVEKTEKSSTNEKRVSLITYKSKQEEMSIYERMEKIQESRNVGLYVLCDRCDKARYLPDVKDPLELPKKWYCHMNPDGKHSDCSDPEEILEDEEFLVEKLYNAGSIVWGKVEGYPWWPAMVEDDPEVEEHFWLEENHKTPTYYHVTFFDTKEVTRAWLRPNAIVPFMANKNNSLYTTSKASKYFSRIKIAMEQAVDAVNLPLIDRLRKYSFIKRYSKPLKEKGRKKIKISEIQKKNKKGRSTMQLKNSKEAEKENNQPSSSREKSIKNKNSNLEKIERKKFRRICAISSMSDSCDNISVILEEINWQNTESLEMDFLNDL